MATCNGTPLATDRINFRVGVHLGDVIVDGDDIYGDGVNVATRLEGLSEPGSVFISRMQNTADLKTIGYISSLSLRFSAVRKYSATRET